MRIMMMMSKDTATARALFRHALPDNRLGREHASLQAYRDGTHNFTAPKRKEYTLIIVTGSGGGDKNRRILLGQKHRGFGKGFYNSFGGKVEEGEAVAVGAARELHEETGISVGVQKMQKSRVGTLHFTFDDGSVEMVVHLFRIRVSFDKLEALENDQVVFLDSPSIIRGCEEITPVWFDDWREIPLNKMFADDTVWLTNVLESPKPLLVDAWFHFLPGGQETNTILHYYLDLKEQEPQQLCSDSSCPNENCAAAVCITNGVRKSDDDNKHLSLEKRLFHALHDNSVTSPSIKEFNESFAYLDAVRSAFGQSRNQRRNAFDYVIDVAGGHGALAALFLLTTSAHTATVVDPARVGQIQAAWGDFLKSDENSKSLRFRHECLRTGLPAELALALQQTRPDRILVVACHACQHLSDEVLEISRRHGVHAAVMPCCQRDPTPGSMWKAASQKLGIPIEKTMDLLLAGKCMAWDSDDGSYCYDVRMKFIDAAITPQNRIIVCRAVTASNENNSSRQRQEAIARAHRKLEKAYRRAHADTISSRPQQQMVNNSSRIAPAALSLLQDARFLGGTAFGFLMAIAVLRR